MRGLPYARYATARKGSSLKWSEVINRYSNCDIFKERQLRAIPSTTSFGDRSHGKDLVASFARGVRGAQKTSETKGGGEGFLSCRPTNDGGRQSELWDSEGGGSSPRVLET